MQKSDPAEKRRALRFLPGEGAVLQLGERFITLNPEKMSAA